MPLLESVIGALAAVISFVLWLPQAVTMWRNRNDPKALAGMSQGTLWLVVCNASLWFLYAYLTQAFWTGAPGLVNLPLAIFGLLLINRSKGQVPAPVRANPCPCGWASNEPHDLLITVGPGYGTVLSPCPRSSGLGVPQPQGPALGLAVATPSLTEG